MGPPNSKVRALPTGGRSSRQAHDPIHSISLLLSRRLCSSLCLVTFTGDILKAFSLSLSDFPGTILEGNPLRLGRSASPSLKEILPPPKESRDPRPTQWGPLVGSPGICILKRILPKFRNFWILHLYWRYLNCIVPRDLTETQGLRVCF